MGQNQFPNVYSQCNRKKVKDLSLIKSHEHQVKTQIECETLIRIKNNLSEQKLNSTETLKIDKSIKKLHMSKGNKGKGIKKKGPEKKIHIKINSLATTFDFFELETLGGFRVNKILFLKCGCVFAKR